MGGGGGGGCYLIGVLVQQNCELRVRASSVAARCDTMTTNNRIVQTVETNGKKHVDTSERGFYLLCREGAWDSVHIL